MDTALFGGTFDPIHNAHLAVARAARDTFGLQRVLVIPAGVPPHKQGRSTEAWEHRYRMVQLACEREPGLEASDVESGTSRSYSIHTIEKLRPTVGGRPYFVIGADAFAEIETWHRWKDVVAAVEFIVVTRPGHDWDTPEGARVHPLRSLDLPVSSSAIRSALGRGEHPPELPDSVFAYIRAHGLYGFRNSV